MGAKSKIEWTDATWNPVAGCTPVSEGCRNCYAASLAYRFSGPGQQYADLAVRVGGRSVFTGAISFNTDKLTQPMAWKKPRKIFVCSMGDLFHESVHFSFIKRVFSVMAATPQHTYQILTKRPERMAEFFRQIKTVMVGVQELCKDPYISWCPTMDLPLPNVWLGTSVENQKTANERIPHLMQCPAVVRFLSCEPLLEPVFIIKPIMDGLKKMGFRSWHYYLNPQQIHWVIAGGESGKKARPMHPCWVHHLRKACQTMKIPFFFKQWGEWHPEAPLYKETHEEQVELPDIDWGDDLVALQPDGIIADGYQPSRGTYLMRRLGKKKSGRELDHVEYNGFPVPKKATGSARKGG